jgi:hypothetical protein
MLSEERRSRDAGDREKDREGVIVKPLGSYGIDVLTRKRRQRPYKKAAFLSLI